MNLHITSVKSILPDAPLWQLVQFSDDSKAYCESGRLIQGCDPKYSKSAATRQAVALPPRKWCPGRHWYRANRCIVHGVMALSWFFILQHRVLVQQFDSSNKLTSSHFSYIEHQITGFSTEQACDQAMAQMVPNTTLRSNLLIVVPCVEKQ